MRGVLMREQMLSAVYQYLLAKIEKAVAWVPRILRDDFWNALIIPLDRVVINWSAKRGCSFR